MPFFESASEIETLVAQFQNQTLPVAAWTHEAHLTVAVWYLTHYNLAEATCLLRSGIITYNNAVGTPNNATRGYHETLTLLWIRIVYYFIVTKKCNDVVDSCNDFLRSEYASREFPLQFDRS